MESDKSIKSRAHCKRKLRYLDLISNTLLLVGLVGTGLLGIPLLNHRTLPLVDAAVMGQEIPCPPGVVEPTFNDAPFDAIAIFGGGVTRADNGTWGPNLFEKERLDTGAGLVAVGYLKPEGDVILLDGKLPDGATKDMDKSYFQNAVLQLSHNAVSILPAHVIVDEVSVNTATNADVLKKNAEEHGWKNILGVTHDYHWQRVDLDTKLRRLCLKSMTVEQYMKLFNPTYVETLKKRNGSDGMEEKKRKEELAILLHYPDPWMTMRTSYKEFINR